jgi:hypothetical protein
VYLPLMGQVITLGARLPQPLNFAVHVRHDGLALGFRLGQLIRITRRKFARERMPQPSILNAQVRRLRAVLWIRG